MKYLCALLLPLSVFILNAQIALAEIYKYQDEQGRWHFSDKKPNDQKLVQNVSIKTRKPQSETSKISLIRQDKDGQIYFWLKNPLFAPVQCYYLLPGNEAAKQIMIKEASEENILVSQDQWLRPKDIEYGCLIGSPDAEPDNQPYSVPFKGFKSLRITQGFGGNFSHNREPQYYAIDIGMPVGTPISAARSGTVIDVQDNYAHSGVSSAFFYDKANYAMVLHEDGTYAMYGHLLIGKVLVKLGDTVEEGELLGYSGNTGFSTGPHLHFVIQYNKQGKPASKRFKLKLSDGTIVKPKTDMWLLPAD